MSLYRRQLNNYIASEFHGNRAAAARAWGVNYATLSGICNGYKGMGKTIAITISTRTGFVLDAHKLMAIKPLPGLRQRHLEGK